MLAPQDPPSNISTPGSSSDALIQSQSQLTSRRAPQEANYQLDDDSRASALVASSPQHITDGYTVPSTYTTDSPYRIPSTARNTHVQSKENSPLVSHPQAYSPTLSSNYIPPPSPTPSQLHAYPMPEGHQQYQHVYQNPYQQTHQQTYQQTYQHQPYPEPTLHAYPAPALVDTVDEKIDQASFVTKPGSNSRRKKIIWIGSVVILILIGAIIGIVISKNKGSDNNGGNSSDNSISGSSSSKPSTTPTPTTSRNPVSLVPVTVSSTPVTVLSTPVTVSSAPVISPKPTPSPPDSGSGGSGRYDAPPLPSLPPKGQCPFTFCGDYYSECRFSICVNDSDYKSCMANCNGEGHCGLDCLQSNPCMKGCSDNVSTCYAHCR